MDYYGIIKYVALYVFEQIEVHKLREDVLPSVFIGVATGVIANVMFVLTTSEKFNVSSLTLSFALAIILLLIGSIEKKEK
jgi:hypothetical protein